MQSSPRRSSSTRPPVPIIQTRKRSSSAPPNHSVNPFIESPISPLVRSPSTNSTDLTYTSAQSTIREGGSTFANGAATLASAVLQHQDAEDLDSRVIDAENALTPKQKCRITKQEKKNGRKLSKIIKNEGKVEKKALGLAIKELDDLQKVQKLAVKTEQKTHASHSKALSTFTTLESSYLSIQSKYQAAQVQHTAEAQALETARERAKEATEHVQDKAKEVDALRMVYGVDEREREVRLGELGTNGGAGRSWWTNAGR